MNLLLAALAIVVLALGGVGLFRVVWPSIRDMPRPARLALGFCVGCWLVTMIFFGAYLAGVSFSRWLVITPVVVLAAVALPGFRGAKFRWEWPALLPAVLCLLALALSWSRPVYGYDAVMMWALKAKMTFFARTWPATMFDPFTTAHTEYPPLIPSAQAFVFFWLGQFDDVASRVVFAAFFASGAAILWWLLGHLQVTLRWVWVTWWGALPVMMEQVKLTYADMPLAVYLLVFFGALVAWLREPSRREWLWLAGLFGGIAFWVKQDALLGVGAGIAALVVLRQWRAWPVLLAVVVALPWRVLVWAKNLPSDFALKFEDLPLKTAQVAAALLHQAIAGGAYGWFWVILVLVLVCRWRTLPQVSWLAVSSLLGLVGIFAVYWFSTPDVPALLQTSLERVLLNLFVPALLVVALLWPETRFLQRGLAVVTVWLGLAMVYQHTRACVELRREFGGKTVAQQHVQAVEPALAMEIAVALERYPTGTHVRVLPKRSLRRHQFYYEAYPYLIVDSSATNVIELVTN